MNTYLKYLRILAPVIILLGLVFLTLYGLKREYSKGYEDGYNAATTHYQSEISKINDEARESEIQLQQQMDRIRDEAYRNQEEANFVISTAYDAIGGLQYAISEARKASTETTCPSQSTTRIVSPTTQCWDILQESIGRYREVAEDADLLVERLRVSQHWGIVIDSLNQEQE